MIRNWEVSTKYGIYKLNQLIQGWINYFKIGDIKKYSNDTHIRCRLRACRWKEWKKVKTKYQNLILRKYYAIPATHSKMTTSEISTISIDFLFLLFVTLLHTSTNFIISCAFQT
ncbi:group II intron maturase-specific domain-containing protein [Bacillus sp. S/N-304-OC-R1]|uniref:group II intron maturase-specific domain-containing protein n=1 Tax=Bacillus sp. S/N-304-OC-R1 TaxID=2758034 RepID=UPI001C8EA2B0|nr:group II intron maturase-specific domain-containing protein [Bacillus sp. S/N-304-OC-R1]MBY0124516.1 hypothetical protein [Bacillus sp. S/N-304-OC-R1]